MKKKIFSLFLAICLIFPCAFILFGCGGPATLTKEEYVKVLDSMANTYNSYLDGMSTSTLELTDDDFEDANNNGQAQSMIKASTALVKFLQNVLNREDYVIKDGVDDCVMTDIYNETFEARFSFSFDKETSTINVPIYAVSDTNILTYFVFDIVYDFENDVVKEFSVSGAMGQVGNISESSVEFYKFKDNTLFGIKKGNEKFTAFATETLAKLNEIESVEKETQPEDYSTEYNNAMLEAWA